LFNVIPFENESGAKINIILWNKQCFFIIYWYYVDNKQFFIHFWTSASNAHQPTMSFYKKIQAKLQL